MSYWVVVVARNAAHHLRNTLDSLLQQTTSAMRITVIDDGSTDETGRILHDYVDRDGIIKVLTLPDRGYDIRRVPSNINLAWAFNEKTGLQSDFFMISGDDCVYPPAYAEILAAKMQSNGRLVVASGSPSTFRGFTREHSPSGSGRMIKCCFWNEAGGRYPLKAGWETWLLCEAARRRLEVRLFNDLSFQHVRPRGAKHQFAYWGAAMGALGYHPLYALGRIARGALSRSVGLKGDVNMLRGYLQSQLGSEDSFISPFDQLLREYVMAEQSQRISMIVSSILRRFGR